MNAKRLIKSEISAALLFLLFFVFALYTMGHASVGDLLEAVAGLWILALTFGVCTGFFYECVFIPPEELHPLDDLIAEISEEHSVQNRASKLNRAESLAGQGKNEDCNDL